MDLFCPLVRQRALWRPIRAEIRQTTAVAAAAAAAAGVAYGAVGAAGEVECVGHRLRGRVVCLLMGRTRVLVG